MNDKVIKHISELPGIKRLARGIRDNLIEGRWTLHSPYDYRFFVIRAGINQFKVTHDGDVEPATKLDTQQCDLEIRVTR